MDDMFSDSLRTPVGGLGVGNGRMGWESLSVFAGGHQAGRGKEGTFMQMSTGVCLVEPRRACALGLKKTSVPMETSVLMKTIVLVRTSVLMATSVLVKTNMLMRTSMLMATSVLLKTSILQEKSVHLEKKECGPG
eukprot:1161411-Pelagomonas_calceolata.AAC.8